MLFVCHPKICISTVFSFSWGHFNSREKLKIMLMQKFGVTNKEHYGMLWHFLEWSIVFLFPLFQTRALLYTLSVPSSVDKWHSTINAFCLLVNDDLLVLNVNTCHRLVRPIIKRMKYTALSPYLHWLCCHLSRHVKQSSQWIFFIRNIRKRKHPLTWTSIDLQSRNSSWAIEIVTFASLLMNARRDARLNTTTSETGNTGNTKWRRD